MTLDERTLFFTLALLPALLAVVTAAFRWGFGADARGLGAWALGLAALAVASFSLTLLQGQTIATLQNVFWVTWMTMTAYGVRRCFDARVRAMPWVAAGGVVYAITVLLSGDPDLAPARRTVITVHHQVCSVGALLGLFGARRERAHLGGYLLGGGLVIGMLGSLQRSVFTLIGEQGTGTFYVAEVNTVVTVFLVALLVAVILITVGLMLLAAERTRRRFEEMATHDGLTGVLNRRGFHAQCEPLLALARRGRLPVALAIIDLDDFKRINDGHGHDVGDEVLVHLARLLAESARSQDLVARFGGEEFVVLMPMTDEEGARQWAERVRTVIEAARCATTTLQVTASFGVRASAFEESTEALYRAADAALYRAKAEGKNRVVMA